MLGVRAGVGVRFGVWVSYAATAGSLAFGACKGVQGDARGSKRDEACTAAPRVNLREPCRHEADVLTPSLTPRAMVRVTSESPAGMRQKSASAMAAP